MTAVPLVTVNAGSSSLKFCRYRIGSDGQPLVEARGAVEGIGSKPRMMVRDGEGRTLVQRDLDRADVGDPRDAVRHVATWLGSHFTERAAAVGHRFVHGGSEFASPVAIEARTLE